MGSGLGLSVMCQSISQFPLHCRVKVTALGAINQNNVWPDRRRSAKLLWVSYKQLVTSRSRLSHDSDCHTIILQLQVPLSRRISETERMPSCTWGKEEV
ncbi:hypothetical protein RRG08_024390 [Elysia crispata]|uniref:Uncharacterized protein n=1 Tax=Elysia crispata TaxID=231223 RepID=A0AAE0YPW5_9GAST|nr:hypothetical protein RRG08_024390 [Elysia crispata]